MGRLGLGQCDALAVHVNTIRWSSSMVEVTTSSPTGGKRSEAANMPQDLKAARSARPADVHRRSWRAQRSR